MQNLDRIKTIKSNWTQEELVAFFDLLDAMLKTYGMPAEFEVKKFWHAVLHRYPAVDVSRALLQALGEKIYGRPTPDLVLQILKGGPTESSATAAWYEVLNAVKRIGPHQSVRFSSPRIAACVKKIGWLALCEATEGRELDRLQTAFKDLFITSGNEVDGPCLIYGLGDMDRINKGLLARPPLQIGQYGSVEVERAQDALPSRIQ